MYLRSTSDLTACRCTPSCDARAGHAPARAGPASRSSTRPSRPTPCCAAGPDHATVDGVVRDRRAPDRRPRPAGPHLDGAAAVRAHDVGAGPARWRSTPLAGRGCRCSPGWRSRRRCGARRASRPALKWPNDVVVARPQARRAAGRAGRDAAARTPAAVIGIGLNVSLRADELPVPTATSLASQGRRRPTARCSPAAVLRTSTGCCSRWDRRRRRSRREGSSVVRRGLLDARAGGRGDLPGGDGRRGRGGRRSTPRVGWSSQTAEGERPFGAGDVLHLRRPA